MTFKLLDCVRLQRDIPHRLLKRGMIGTVVEVFERPDEAYEVEFCDDNGATIAQLALQPSDIMLEKAHKPG